MDWVQLPASEWNEIKDLLYDIRSMLKTHPNNLKTWVTIREFRTITSKTVDQVKYLLDK